MRKPTIQCMICGQLFQAITPAHLSRHGLNMSQYKQQFPNAPIIDEAAKNFFSARVAGAQNPGFQHNGRLSPFSKKFVSGDISEQTKQRAQASKRENCGDPCRLDYYLHRGMTPADAKKALSDHQTTFSLEKCIRKYGEVEGRARHQARQLKWQKTLNSKSPEEIARINRSKGSRRTTPNFTIR